MRKPLLRQYQGLQTQAPGALRGLDETFPPTQTILPGIAGHQEGTDSSEARERAQHTWERVRTKLATLPLKPLSRDGAEEYQLQRLLGEGGMGKVYLAQQHSLERKVAIKRAKKEVSPQELMALLQEALLVGVLEHPNIIPVYDLAQDDDGKPLLVMKHVEGTRWADVLHSPEHPALQHFQGAHLVRQIEILLQICHAVEYAHHEGVLHLDIKPSNVMLGPFGEVYLLDWGVAQAIPHPDETNHPCQLCGTPAYMAPELLAADAHDVLGRYTDVYLLGATLHELLTGAPLHVGQTLTEVFDSVRRSAPQSYDASIPAELVEICHKATHLEPSQRYEDVPAFRQALHAYLEHRHSYELASAAKVSMAQCVEALKLEPLQHTEIHRHFYESRFGFLQALRSWPDNREAKEGYIECLRMMYVYEVGCRNDQAAEALLSDLTREQYLGDSVLISDEALSVLRQELTSLRQSLKEEKQQSESFRAMSYQEDLSISQKQRISLLKVGAFVLSLFILLISGLALLKGLKPIDAFVRVRNSVIVFVTYSGVLFFMRDSLLKNRASRRLMASIWLIMLIMVFHRVANYVFSLPIRYNFLGEILLFACGSGMMGLGIHRRFLLHSAIFLVSAVCALCFPFLSIPLLGLSLVLTIWTSLNLSAADLRGSLIDEGKESRES